MDKRIYIIILLIIISFSSPLTAKTESMEDVLSSLYNPDSSFNLTIDINKGNNGTYSIGEKIVINFTADTDCYVTLFDINSKNNVTLLYPHTYSVNNFIQKGKNYSFPEKDAEWEWVLGTPPGKETVIGIATKEPVSIIDDLVKIIKEQFMPDLSSNPGDFFSRTILLKVKNQNNIHWTSSIISFNLVTTIEETFLPQIELTRPAIPSDGNSIVTGESIITLIGTARDDKEITGFKILVNDLSTSRAPVVRGKKVYEFNNTVILEKGKNKITIIVEDIDKNIIKKEFWVECN